MLCPSCQSVEDADRHEMRKEISQAIVTYLQGFPEGRSAQEICTHFNCEDSSEEKKQLLICIKKLAEVGLISSKAQGMFIATVALSQSSSNDIIAPNLQDTTPNKPTINNTIRPVEAGEAKFSTPPTPNKFRPNNYFDINKEMIGFFATPRLLKDAILEFRGCGSETVFDRVMKLEEAGLICRDHRDDGIYFIAKDKVQSYKLVITDLDDIIIDICFEKPQPETAIISTCQQKGYQQVDIEKALAALRKSKMKKYTQGNVVMYSYTGENGIRAMPEMDVGV